MVVEVEPYHQYPITHFASQQMAAEGQSEKMTSNMEAYEEKVWNILPSAEKNTPIDIY